MCTVWIKRYKSQVKIRGEVSFSRKPLPSAKVALTIVYKHKCHLSIGTKRKGEMTFVTKSSFWSLWQQWATSKIVLRLYQDTSCQSHPLEPSKWKEGEVKQRNLSFRTRNPTQSNLHSVKIGNSHFATPKVGNEASRHYTQLARRSHRYVSSDTSKPLTKKGYLRNEANAAYSQATAESSTANLSREEYQW
jgi:hypothetical protein